MNHTGSGIITTSTTISEDRRKIKNEGKWDNCILIHNQIPTSNYMETEID